jgi:hypothetical protein
LLGIASAEKGIGGQIFQSLKRWPADTIFAKPGALSPHWIDDWMLILALVLF